MFRLKPPVPVPPPPPVKDEPHTADPRMDTARIEMALRIVELEEQVLQRDQRIRELECKLRGGNSHAIGGGSTTRW